MRGSAYRAAAAVSAVGCGVLMLAAAPALAATSVQAAGAVPASPAAVTSSAPQWPSHTRSVNHFNVGAPHSPRLLRQLAGPAGATRAGASAATAPPAMPGALQGIDVSSYQEAPGINWKSVYTAGMKFAAIKVTEGTYYANPYASADLTAARAAGLAVVAYAFAIPNGDGGSASPVTQADFAIAHAAGLHGNVPPIMLDIEYDPYSSQDGTNECYGLSQSAMATWIQEFSDEVRARTGQDPIVYTPRGWWSTCVGSQTPAVGQDPLWAVRDNGSTTGPGTLPLPWRSGTWTYWQYGQSTNVSGISGTVDLDQLNPAQFTVLAPGDPQTRQGQQITPVPLHSSQAGTTFSAAAALPSWLSLDPATGVLSGTGSPPPSSSYGPHAIAVTATPPAATGAQPVTVRFTWYVHGIMSTRAPGDQTTVAGSPVGVRAHASDSPQASPLTFSAAGLPPGVTMTSGGLMTGFAQTPGTYHVTVSGHDAWHANGGSAGFTWTVKRAPDRGPAGHVRLDLGDRCLRDVRNRSRDGNETEIWKCTASSAEHWTYVQDGTVRIHGKCLTAPSHPGWKVRLEACDGAPAAQWVLASPRSVNPAAHGTALTLVNLSSGWCLADPGGIRRKGTRVIATTCDGRRDQAWRMRPGQIASQVPGKCAYDNRNRRSNRTPVVLHRCRNIAAERWTVEPDGTVRVHGRCLTVARGRTSAGTRVWLWRCSRRTGSRRGRSQQWRLVPTGAGTALVNPASGRCLTDPGNATRNRTRLRIESCAADIGQIWRTA